MNVAKEDGKAEAKLSLANTSAARKGWAAGELDWKLALKAGLPCSVDFLASKRRKILWSLPNRQGGRPRVTSWQVVLQLWFVIAALAPGLPLPHDRENGHSRLFSPPWQFTEWQCQGSVSVGCEGACGDRERHRRSPSDESIHFTNIH